LVQREYKDKEGNVKTKSSITYDPFVKSKMWLLASCMVKVSSEPKPGEFSYRKFYENKKARMLAMQEAGTGYVQHEKEIVNDKGKKVTIYCWTKQHIHNAACTYMKQVFLRDFHMVSRAVEGLPVVLPWYLRMVQGQTTLTEEAMKHHPSQIKELLDSLGATYLQAYQKDGNPFKTEQEIEEITGVLKKERGLLTP
jgi:hypothetical protein